MVYIFAFLLGAVLFTFMWLVFMRKQLLEKSQKLDADVYTASDFCLMGKNMKFDDYRADAIRNTII